MTRLPATTLAALLLTGCGFEAVEECYASGCSAMDAGTARDGGAPADAGRDAGFDAGVSRDAGIDAGLDAGADAGRDAGVTNPPDAGVLRDAGCYASLTGPGDLVSVTGFAGIYGQVDYVIGGYSAGVSAPSGIQRFTNSAYVARGLPAGVLDTGLWMWPSGGTVATDTDYFGHNLTQSSVDSLVNFRIFPGVSCPEGLGRGRFKFTRYAVPPSNVTPVEGDFEFQCPDAGIDVRGCFHYER